MGDQSHKASRLKREITGDSLNVSGVPHPTGIVSRLMQKKYHLGFDMWWNEGTPTFLTIQSK
jgi:hypothetical protein